MIREKEEKGREREINQKNKIDNIKIVSYLVFQMIM